MSTSVLRSPYIRVISRVGLLVGGMVLGVGLTVFLLRSVNLGQLGNAFSQADYGYLLLAFVALAVNITIKVPRWGVLLGEDAPSWDLMFGAINIGYAVNTLLPARLGDLVRAYWIRDLAGISMVRALSTIAVERVMDGITVLLLFLVLTPTVAFPAALRGSALAAGALFIVVLAMMIVIAHSMAGDNWISRRVTRLEEGRFAIGARMLHQVTAGLQVLHSWRAIALVLLYTAIIWAANGFVLWFVLLAFHIDAPYAAGVLGNSVVSLGMTVPSTPGYIGIFDYLIVVTLGLYGVHRTQALAAAFMFHAIAFIPVTIIGIIYIARTGLRATMRVVRAGSKKASAEEMGKELPEATTEQA